MASPSLSFIGCPHDIENLKVMNDRLNAKVMEQVNDSQELILLNAFAHEANEYLIKKCLEDRISNVASWQWVLSDLSKRISEGIDKLNYEAGVLQVVVRRVQCEIMQLCTKGSRPGALRPLCDSVEEAIYEEYNYLRYQKKSFAELIPHIQQHIKNLELTKKRIDHDVNLKRETISVEEACATIDTETAKIPWVHKKKRADPICRWENKCLRLKQAGLKALCNSIIIRQQIRGARMELSISAQAYAAKVNTVLRRRLHNNRVQLQDLSWQKEEALLDFKSLNEELAVAEENLFTTLEQERVVEARLADRSQRPAGELIRDQVDRRLKDELGRSRHFSKKLRDNIKRIISLQNNLTVAIEKIDCCARDISQIIQLDEERIRRRNPDTCDDDPNASSMPNNSHDDDVPGDNNPKVLISKINIPDDAVNDIPEEINLDDNDSDENQAEDNIAEDAGNIDNRNRSMHSPTDSLEVIKEEDEVEDEEDEFVAELDMVAGTDEEIQALHEEIEENVAEDEDEYPFDY